MHESAAEVAALQELLDRSYARAGPHLLDIHTPERRMAAEHVCARLTGMCLLTLATVTADGRPVVGPVDGIFYRGAFHFGSSPQSVRVGHIRRRPQVSATHAPGEELAVTVHGQAVAVDLGAPDSDGFKRTLRDIYVPRYGRQWEEFLHSGPVYFRIEAERMFAFSASADRAQFARPLREEDVDRDPLRQFSTWFEEARHHPGVRMAEAAALATATPDGAPTARMVLVKETDAGGFVFYSNFDSRKGRELAANPRAALVFYWDPLGRQVRIEGRVERMAQEESVRYIRTRPRGSQLSALASPQSRTVESREWLEQRVAELAGGDEGRELPLPHAWGGFRLRPHSFEFWQHREDRLHDRLRYTEAGGEGWRLERLAP